MGVRLTNPRLTNPLSNPNINHHPNQRQSLALNGALLLGSHYAYHIGLAPLIAGMGQWLFAPFGEADRCVRCGVYVYVCVYKSGAIIPGDTD